MQNQSLHEQAVWNARYADLGFSEPRKFNMIRQFIEEHLPRAASPNASALEIGCFPGGLLAVMGKLGYVLNGFDLAPRIGDMAHWLRDSGYTVGRMEKEDFFSADVPSYRSDAVLSNGFIEHFENWPEVLTRHAQLVKPGGRILLTAPNFRGRVQRWLHEELDKANLERHYLPSMNPEAWAEGLRAQGFEILWSGYFGGFNFWVEEQPRTALQKLAVACLRFVRLPLRLLPNHPSYSPYCGVVARRRFD